LRPFNQFALDQHTRLAARYATRLIVKALRQLVRLQGFEQNSKPPPGLTAFNSQHLPYT
jgi:hypothetical protein